MVSSLENQYDFPMVILKNSYIIAEVIQRIRAAKENLHQRREPSTMAMNPIPEMVLIMTFFIGN